MSNRADTIYDTVIIGGGPAGYTAALYAARAGMNTLVLEKLSAGGQMTQTSVIDNYPGFHEGIDGFTLGFNMQQGAERFGAKTLSTEVLSVSLKGDIKEIHSDMGRFLAQTVIIAAGADHRHLGIENEESLIGRGVGYCAHCDGMFYKGKTVAVVGGGNSAVSDALFLSRICTKVFLIHRRDTLRAERIYHEPLQNAENVEFIFNARVKELLFENKLTGVVYEELISGELRTLPLEGLFISIGRSPQSKIFAEEVALDELGYIIADESTRTNIPGVFAAGDIRTKKLRQVVTAASDGAVAATEAFEYLTKKK